MRFQISLYGIVIEQRVVDIEQKDNFIYLDHASNRLFGTPKATVKQRRFFDVAYYLGSIGRCTCRCWGCGCGKDVPIVCRSAKNLTSSLLLNVPIAPSRFTKPHD